MERCLAKYFGLLASLQEKKLEMCLIQAFANPNRLPKKYNTPTFAKI